MSAGFKKWAFNLGIAAAVVVVLDVGLAQVYKSLIERGPQSSDAKVQSKGRVPVFRLPP